MSTPTWQPASAPPPRANAPVPRPDRPERSRPPSPIAPEPVGRPLPAGSAWPPPEGDPTVCLLREMSGRELQTKCGRYIRLPKGATQSDHATIWRCDVTCSRCLARMGPLASMDSDAEPVPQ